MSNFMFLCIDVGNSRIKFAAFPAKAQPSTMPKSSLAIANDSPSWQSLDAWLANHAKSEQAIGCWMTSVDQAASDKLQQYLRQTHNISEVQTLSGQDFPLEIAVDQPELVGVDRLAAAYAGHLLTDPNRATIVVDYGSAITVDRVSATGQFEGGAILAGIDLASDALHRRTHALPQVHLTFDGPAPELPGKSTEQAIAAGLYWGAVGAVRELIGRLSHGLQSEPAVFVTGGAAEKLTLSLGSAAHYEPDLVLRGIALVASEHEKVSSSNRATQ
jgi:type III pantothenate kinase